MSHFPKVTELLNKRVVEIATEMNNITKEINKHSDYKANMNNYRVVNAPLLAALSERLVALEHEGREINHTYRALINNGVILTNASISSVEFYLVQLFDRLPDHVQEEWKDNFQEIQKCLAAGRGLK